MRFVTLLALGCVAALSDFTSATEPDPKLLIKQVVTAVGGEDKLLKLFRTRETVNVSADPEKKVPARASVYEPPNYWWTGKTERVVNENEPKEPATFLVWAWTIGALTDPRSKVEAIAEVQETDRPAFGLRISGTIEPAMDLYFDKDSSLLVRIDWRTDIHRFSDWKEHDGVKYAARTVIFKKAGGKPWFFHEVTELERLKALPEGITRP
jgi:hypothetical protein